MTTAVETSLSVLAPINIVTAMLTSSSVPETDYAAWNAGTTYAIGDRVILTSTHRIYESLKAGNLNKDPSSPANQTGSPAWWLEVGPTNRWAMFDNNTSTATSGASPLTVVIKPGFSNSIYLGKINAGHLHLTVKDAPGGNVIYDYDADLENSAPPDYYEYFFDPFDPQEDFLARDIPPYNNMEYTIVLSTTGGTPSVGLCAIGDLKPLGSTQYGAKVKPKTYSFMKTDSFGNVTIIRRQSATDMSASAIMPLINANTVLKTVQSVLDVPCVWVGTDLPEYSGLRVFGLGSGELEYVNYSEAQLSISVQGMI